MLHFFKGMDLQLIFETLHDSVWGTNQGFLPKSLSEGKKSFNCYGSSGMQKETSSPVVSASTAISRELQLLSSTAVSNSKSPVISSQKLPLLKGASVVIEVVDDHDHHSQVHPGSTNKGRTENQHSALKDDSKYSTVSAHIGQPANGLFIENLDETTDSNCIEVSGIDFRKVSSRQTESRNLPPSSQPSSLISTFNVSMHNGCTGQIPESRGKSYNLFGTNTDAHKVYMKNHLGRSGDDDVIMYEQSGNRRLPPSLMNGKPLATSQTARLSDSATHGKSYNFVWTNVADHKVYMENHFGGSGDDGVIMYERNGNRLLTPSLMNGAPANSPIASMSDSAHRSGVEERYTEYDERIIFQAALQDLSQPKVEATLPDGLLTVPLLRHQKIALAWLVQRETTSLHCFGGILADDQGLGKTVSMIALIQKQRDLQSKSTSGDPKKKKNDTWNLEDDDELEKVMHIGESNDLKIIPEVSIAVPAACHKGRLAAGTLVVCPASILHQWAKELDDKVSDGAKLSVLIYHGSTRTKNPVELAKYDVVLTTYSIVTNEVPKQRAADDDDGDSEKGEKYGLPSEFSINKKRKKTSNADKKGRKSKKRTKLSSIGCESGLLARVSWFRVILDEAQTIKNHRTQAAKACCGLRAKRRWCLSGTPIQNKIDDLYSYFRFLKYHPYAVYKIFCSSIKYPTSRNSSEGYKKLQVVLKTILLRRTKETLIDGKPILTLPPKSVCLVKVEFSTEERTFYAQLEANSRLQFKEYAAAGTVNQNYANILLLLLRLRQACDHPLLVEGIHSKSIGKTSLQMARRLSRDMLLRLLNLLEDSLAICSECSDPPEDAVVTLCGHVFCHQCVAEHLMGDDNLCPAPNCKNHLSADVVFSKATLNRYIPVELANNATSSSQVTEKSTILQNSYSSSKIKAAMEILKSNCKLKNRSAEISSEGCNGISFSSEERCNSDVNAVEYSNSHLEAPVKTIVFSQWTSMLDLLEIPLNQSCMQYRRLDGTMSLALRDKAVKDFNTDPEVTVMLMSLKAGNLGLNMVAACHVILLDLWWNPTTEDQAIDRTHRIGQTRPVTVSRLTISNTVEDRILSLQEKKRKLVASAFGEDQAGGSATRLTVEDLRYLFMV
ncbi:SNF2-related [Macleaya cordata]|uniref:SNF2-related n=1 Tax=Macleaya cordata TaxID=56857 RepID=A0A200QJN4_MACCD|nr:SNF2-related [Macleaya cordata]